MIDSRFYIRRTDGKSIPPPSVDLLARMYNTDGMTAKEIAEQLQLSKRYIQNQIQRRGLSRGGKIPRQYGPNLQTQGQVISQSFLSRSF